MRETITRLETLGLLKTEPQSGTYVCNYPKEASFELLIYLMENHEALNPEVFSSLMQVRELMETAAVNTIVTSKNRSIILNKLREITKKIRKTDPEQIEIIMELDYAFHNTIVEGSGNIIFESLFRTSKTVHQFYTKAFFSHKKALNKTLTQYDALLLAIDSGDADAAIEALCEMLEYGSQQVREYIGIKPGS